MHGHIVALGRIGASCFGFCSPTRAPSSEVPSLLCFTSAVISPLPPILACRSKPCFDFAAVHFDEAWLRPTPDEAVPRRPAVRESRADADEATLEGARLWRQKGPKRRSQSGGHYSHRDWRPSAAA